MISEKYKELLQVSLIVLLTVASLLIMWVIVIPTTPTDAHEYADYYHPYDETDRYFAYAYPYKDTYMVDVIEIDVSEEDFKECAKIKYLRYPSIVAQGCGHYLCPTDKYVMQIAERISDKTEGQSVEDKAKTVMEFVKYNIPYLSDYELWGTSDYCATPTETLYLKAGDCEDRSILTVSIFIAMGLDGALLDYENHIAPGIRYPGETEYRSADFCYVSPSVDLCSEGEYPRIYNNSPEYSIILSKGIGSARYFVRDLFGI